MSIVDTIFTLFERRGHAAYFGEPVSQLEHALQTAHQADQRGAPDYLIAAALLHDIGHLLHGMPDDIAALGVDRGIAVRVVSLIDRNEYKRRQAAPGLKITSKAFGVGRRYPIAADYGEMTRARAEATAAPEVRAGTPEP